MLKNIYLLTIVVIGFSLMAYGFSNPANFGKIYRIIVEDSQEPLISHKVDLNKLTYKEYVDQFNDFSSCEKMNVILNVIENTLFSDIENTIDLENVVENNDFSDFQKFYVKDKFKLEQCFYKDKNCLTFVSSAGKKALYNSPLPDNLYNLGKGPAYRAYDNGICRSDFNILSSIYFKLIEGKKIESIASKILTNVDFFVDENGYIKDFYVKSVDEVVERSTIELTLQ